MENNKSGQKNKLQENKLQRNELQREKDFQAHICFERYEILEILGKGGTGTVYLAQDIRLGRLVAVKILGEVTRQFREEIQILQKQGLSMLPVIFDAWMQEDGHTGVIVMEYVKGQNLREYLELHRQISEKQIYSWGLQLGEFLQKLHSLNPKVLYRDLKPENIMIQPDKSLRLVDVGAALCAGETCKEEKPDDEEWEKLRRIRVGTFGFASPEQWRGEKVDERTDIYSLGAVLWLMGAGRIQGECDGKISGMPRGMVSVIRRCLREDKEKRYATAAAFLGAWKRYRRAGLWTALGGILLRIGKYSMLLAAVYVIWLEPGRFWWNLGGYWEGYEDMRLGPERWMSLLYCLAGYAVIKWIEKMSERGLADWEQKKSVWCRGWGS